MCDPSYLAWCEQQGISMHGVQPALVPRGWRGVVATQQLLPGHVVMRVPQGVLLSVLSARQDPLLGQLLHSHQLSSHQVLTVHLLAEASKGAASRWWPYIQALPRSFTTCANWDTPALQALQVPYAESSAAAAVLKAKQDWAAARPLMQQLGLARKWCSWRGWQWASSAVLSRTMYHPADPPTGCLTPLGDLHNYAPPPPPHTPQLQQDLHTLITQQQQQQKGTALQQKGTASQLQQEDASVGVGVKQPLAASQPGADTPHCSQQNDATGGLMHSPVPDAAAPNSSSTVAAAVTQCSSCEQGGGAAAVACSSHACSVAAVSQQPAAAAAAAADTTSMAPCTAGGTGAAAAAASVPTVPAASTPPAVTAAAAAAAAADEGGSSECCAAISGDGHFDAAEGCYKIVARRCYSPGAEVLLCYGAHTTLELLEVYGFLLDHNPHDTALLPPDTLQQQLQQAVAHHHTQQQQQAVGRRAFSRQQQQQGPAVELGVSAADCWLHANGQPSWQLLSQLRCAAASAIGEASASHKALCGDPVSLASEVLVLQSLAGACRATLAALPTSLEEDLRLLQQGPSPQAAVAAASATATATVAVTVAAKGHAANGVSRTAGAAQAEDGSQGACGGAAASAAHCEGSTAAGSANSPESTSAAGEQQQQECFELAVGWRAAYKASLLACVERCGALLVTAAAATQQHGCNGT